jgi:hypothetical protein
LLKLSFFLQTANHLKNQLKCDLVSYSKTTFGLLSYSPI